MRQVLVIGLALSALVACGAPDTPGEAAATWADKALHGDDDVKDLECDPDQHEQIEIVKMTAAAISGFKAVSTARLTSKQWKVELESQPAKGGSTFSVTVIERDGKYLVCD